ncbi:MAG: hypothetical protein ACW964_19795, partial [Candidatus Hodarchaeales archaeon]
MPIPPKSHGLRSIEILIKNIDHITEKCQISDVFKKTQFQLFNKSEFNISILSGIWIITYFNSFKKFKSLDEFLRILNKLKQLNPNSMPIWNFITTLFKYLDEKNLVSPLFEVEFPKMERIFSNDILGTYL